MLISSLATWTDQAQALIKANIALAEPIVFALGFAESIAFVSLLVPSTWLFLAIGGMHSTAGGAFWTTCLAGATGAFIGDIVSYAMGRFFKGELGNIWPFSRYPDWYAGALGLFRKWGFLSILGGKFLGFARPFLPVVAGAAHMPFASFLVASALSSLAWAGVFLAPGYGITWLMR